MFRSAGLCYSICTQSTLLQSPCAQQSYVLCVSRHVLLCVYVLSVLGSGRLLIMLIDDALYRPTTLLFSYGQLRREV